MIISLDDLDDISRQLGGLVVKSLACCAGGPGSIPGYGTQNFQMAFISKISASLSITCDVKPEGALYSLFYAEASKKPHIWELIGVPCCGLTALSSCLCFPQNLMYAPE